MREWEEGSEALARREGVERGRAWEGRRGMGGTWEERGRGWRRVLGREKRFVEARGRKGSVGEAGKRMERPAGGGKNWRTLAGWGRPLEDGWT